MYFLYRDGTSICINTDDDLRGLSLCATVLRGTTWAGFRASNVGSEGMQAAGDDRCTLMWLNCNRATEEPSPDRGLGNDRWSLSTGHFTILTVISDRGC